MNPPVADVQDTAVITGALGAMVICVCGAGLGVTSVLGAAINCVRRKVMVPAVVPVRTPSPAGWNTPVVCPAGIVNVAVREPLVKPTV